MEENGAVFVRKRIVWNSPSSNECFDRLIFPYHVFEKPDKAGTVEKETSSIRSDIHSFKTPFTLLRQFIFSEVKAAQKEADVTTNVSDVENIEKMKNTQNLEALAKAYIQKESGWERVTSLFERDHRGKNNIELSYMQVTIAQVFLLSFFLKYFPAAKFARKEFIRENQGTVFRTRIEALRLMQDHTFMKAGWEAGVFSTKITLLSSSFLLISSLISRYRNKTSGWEFAVAAGITGGLSRINMGLMGLVVGSVVGGALGSAVGLIGYISLSAYGFTQEERHLEAMMEKLEVFRSIEGEKGFKERVNLLLAEDKTLIAPSTS